MKKNFYLLFLLLTAAKVFSQNYEDLQKLSGVKQNVYFSKDDKARAVKISDNIIKAEGYFEKEFQVHPQYTLLVLSPADWKKYAHPNAIYGIPHYLPDGRLVVASENNEFWKRNTPPVDKLSAELAKKLKDTYADKSGEIALTDFFDLLAVHELGHAFQKAAGMTRQRSWLSELFCNILLHTYIAENDPKLLPALTTFPLVTVAAFPPERLKYSSLADFENNYEDLAQNHPDNYGWYQCRFHTFAAQIYDAGGASVMKNLWAALLSQKEKLDDSALKNLLQNTDPALAAAIQNWRK